MKSRVAVLCMFLVFVSVAITAGADPDPRRPFAGTRMADHLLVRIDAISGEYQIKGLYTGSPENMAGIFPEDISKGPFAVVLTETGGSLIKPVLVRDAGNSELDVLVPFSINWHATEIVLANVPDSPRESSALRAISISGDALRENYTAMRSLRAGQLSKLVQRPEIGDCYPTGGGCSLCYFCYEVWFFGWRELCQAPVSYC